MLVTFCGQTYWTGRSRPARLSGARIETMQLTGTLEPCGPSVAPLD